MSSKQLVAVAGRGIVPSGKNVVTADDLGLTRGDGVFDATRVVTADDGVSSVDNLDEHLERLAASITGLGDEPPQAQEWRDLVEEAVEAWSHPGEATLKLMYTRGGEASHSEPVKLLTITKITRSALAQRQGLSAVLLPRGHASDAFADAPWLLGGVKSLSYAVNQAARREAERRGAEDVIFTSSDGYCLEGPTSALLVANGKTLTTTPTGATGILDSITQRTVFHNAQAKGWQTEFRLLEPKELFSADGVWLLSSIRGAAPVKVLDGTPLAVDEKLSAKVTRWAGF